MVLAACTTGEASTTPPPAPVEQVYLEGVIANADTGRGVVGAQMFILRPGLTASAAASDDALTEDEVVTFGITDRSGYYQTQHPVARGQTYSVIIVANGYRPVMADNGLDLPSNATNPTQVNAAMRPAR